MRMNYHPKPIPSGHVKLPPELLELTEKLAENTHEIWASERLAQGWTYGPARDDKTKTHPCLVPYEALPESEREYDRKTALGALKAIMAFGYRIEKSVEH